MLVIVLGLVLTACSGSGSNGNSDKNNNTSANKENQFVTTKTTKEMVDGMLAKIEQPALVEMTGDMVKQMYYFDPALLEEYTIMSPMMNVKTNEVAVFKVKDTKDIAAVEEGVKKRAADVQKTFETYLQDQYENAKNYKLVAKGNYVFFVISDQPDKFVTEFDSYFEQK
jgi:predicted nucleotidyltransferase